ncbi:MAG TPA: hypothetical protein G4O00_06550 [Thermoflexia bacterium]|nr:hypothetical protein [Thermoflexia bacterium]
MVLVPRLRKDVGRDGVPPYICRKRRGPLTCVAALLMALLVAVPVRAQSIPPYRAGLVVVHGDGRVVTRCVGFEEESISGADLLRRSGLPVTLSAFGGLGEAVCAIDGEGCPAGDCFCQCEGNTCAYWVYSHLQPDGTWAISPVGAGAWRLKDGDVDGWVWGDGTTVPPSISFDAICSPSAAPTPPAPPSPTPLTSLTPTPFVSPTPSSSVSPLPSSSNYVLFVLLFLLLAGGLAWTAMRRQR